MTDAEQSHFNRFMAVLQDFLYDQGWYTQSMYVEKRRTYAEVEQYLIDHCYGSTEAREIVARIKLRTM